MATEDVRTRIEGGILEVVIDRPKANAIDRATSIRLGEIFLGFRDNPDLRVAIIMGGGEKFFCAGWDLKAAASGEEVDGDYGIGGFGGIQELENFNKPVICAVNGICCGGGFEIALGADIIIAVDSASFALPSGYVATLRSLSAEDPRSSAAIRKSPPPAAAMPRCCRSRACSPSSAGV